MQGNASSKVEVVTFIKQARKQHKNIQTINLQTQIFDQNQNQKH
jgi:hypothetical protein